MEHEPSEHPRAHHREPGGATGRFRDRTGLVADLLTAAAGLVGLVQALRADPLWPLWVLVGALALASLLAYRLRQRRWRAAAVSLSVLLLLGGGGGLLALTGDEDPPPAGAALPSDAVPDGGAPHGTPANTGAPPTTATTPDPGGPSPGSQSGGTTAPAADEDGRVVFSDVVQLDKQTGVDLDGGRAELRYAQDAVVDLYLDWGYILYGSARHSQLHDDNNAGPEEGARNRCRTYREAARAGSTSTYIGGGNQQKCFTTSDGRPGWVQAVNMVGNGGLLLKVTVWAD